MTGKLPVFAVLWVLALGPISVLAAPEKRLPPLPRAKPAVTASVQHTARLAPVEHTAPDARGRAARFAPDEHGAALPAVPHLPEAHALEDQRQHLECVRLLGTAVASLASVPTPPRSDCLVNHPVTLAAAGAVRLPARPLLACGFARAFSNWASSSVAALAKHHLGQPLLSIETGPGYVCRGRNGASSGKISEHGLGNAIDIAAFTLKDGKRIAVADPLGLDADVRAFLTAVRATACGYFTTVLGPGADDAHRDHMHIDLGQHGKSTRYRICQ